MYKSVKDFMSATGQKTCESILEQEDTTYSRLYLRLITEEFLELMSSAVPKDDFVDSTLKSVEKILYELIDLKKEDFTIQDKLNVADDLSDIVYVVNGLANVLGIDLDKVNEEVHGSNMSKLNPETGFADKDSNGKVIKGINYFKPNIKKVLLGE